MHFDENYQNYLTCRSCEAVHEKNMGAKNENGVREGDMQGESEPSI